mmetsp:Transcript_22020/g.38785  ORF Transcript_22020/g.38785 Transcript_22020/m.38785 type:complete len:207 (+) Transcript_22020:78-698(+)
MSFGSAKPAKVLGTTPVTTTVGTTMPASVISASPVVEALPAATVVAAAPAALPATVPATVISASPATEIASAAPAIEYVTPTRTLAATTAPAAGTTTIGAIAPAVGTTTIGAAAGTVKMARVLNAETLATPTTITEPKVTFLPPQVTASPTVTYTEAGATMRDMGAMGAFPTATSMLYTGTVTEAAATAVVTKSKPTMKKAKRGCC